MCADPADIIGWIDTTVMVADCLTERLKGDFVQIVADTNIWNFEQTAEARPVKLKKTGPEEAYEGRAPRRRSFRRKHRIDPLVLNQDTEA